MIEENSQVIKVGPLWGLDVQPHIQDLRLSTDTISVKRFAVDCQLQLPWPEDVEMTIEWPENIARASEYATNWLKQAILRGFDTATLQDAVLLIQDACYLFGFQAEKELPAERYQAWRENWLKQAGELLKQRKGDGSQN